MIIDSKSCLRHPPKVLDIENVVTFNAITYCVDMCEISFNHLLKDLNKFSDNPKSEGQIFPNIFLNVWALITNSVMLIDIIKKNYTVEDDKVIFEINKAQLLRNTNQHIGERITEILSLKELPVFGSLSWYKINRVTNQSEQFFLYSGSFEIPDNISGTIITADNNKAINEIGEIIFTSVTKIKKPESYPEITISIFSIINEIKNIINEIEYAINKQLKDEDKNDCYNSNLFFVGKKNINT
jgi:hypothetical protein